ncbi:STAS domain-containing protein [Aliikangiella sp. IMCC44359]|uniref:STAS domain-containing protein n=1 Tax=Aliikangiella sp. IMCC44359 TaxID=3459125 RepID=UPI00403AA44F
MDGAVFATSVDGIDYIKFEGTVRYSHCAGLEAHIDQLFDNGLLNEIVIDLEDAEILDSTALGLLAKVAIEMKKRTEKRPVIFMARGELNNIIKRVCFDQVFNLVFDNKRQPLDELEELVGQPQDDETVLKRVIEAHRSLAELSKENESLYRDITSAL